jgi:hypothetical protein
MATKITIVPDLYFRNWREDGQAGPDTGEMWLVLRPMVAGSIDEKYPERVLDLRDWATGSADSRNFEFASPSPSACAGEGSYLPVNLPSDLQVRVRVGGTPGAQISIPRPRGCYVLPNAANRPDKPFLPHPPGTGTPFPTAFNDEIREKLLRHPDSDELSAFHAITQLLDFGKRIAWNEEEVRQPWPGIAIPELEPGASGHVTSLYWLLGLMVPLGTQADIAKLRAITNLDIELVRDEQVIWDTRLPDLQPLSEAVPGAPGSGQLNLSTYFSRIGTGFKRQLEGKIESREHVTYVQPGFRSARWDEKALQDGTLWRIESPGGVPNDEGVIARTLRTDQRNADRPRQGVPLKWLAAVEARGNLEKDAPDGLGSRQGITFEPGLAIDGSLSLYRRFPDPPARAGGDDMRPTLLRFDPDPGSADVLDALLARLGPAEFKPVFNGAVGSGEAGWTLELLHAGRLPWDGPRNVYRILAAPPAGARAPEGASTAYPGRTLAMFIGSGRRLAPNVTGDNPRRYIWSGGSVAATPAALQAWWEREAPRWAGSMVNAVRVTGVADSKEAALTLMAVNEYSFAPAESAVRLEKILTVEGSAFCGSTDYNDPRPDYEDDLVNFNSAKLIENGRLVDPRQLRIPQVVKAGQGEVGTLANRDQYIPLVEGWPRDPSDRRDTRSPVHWTQIRDMIAGHYRLKPDAAPGPFRAPLEHSYGDRMEVSPTPPEFSLATRLDWPVDVASAVVRVDSRPRSVHVPELSDSIDQPKRFLSAEYDYASDIAVLRFDVALLDPVYVAPTGDDAAAAESNKAYAAGVAAWRSLAELAVPAATVELLVEVATYDLIASLPAAAAELVAKRGFQGGLSEGVASRPDRLRRVSIPANHPLREWADRVMKGSGTDAVADPGPFRVRLGNGGEKVGDVAHAAQLVLSVRRGRDQAGPAPLAQTLLPFSQQPGLFTTAENSLQEVWARLGFGHTSAPLNSRPDSQAPDLKQAHEAWGERLESGRHSVFTTDQSAQAGGPEATAIISALDGSDWFVSEGPGPQAAAKTANAILVPLGFAPARPHRGLESATQTALQRLAAALADTVDVAFDSWAKSSAEDWRKRFPRIAALAQESGSEWSGNLAEFAKLVATRLLKPQPANDPANHRDVIAIARAIEENKGDLAWTDAAVERLLMDNPALFLDAKALMVNALRFTASGASGKGPPISTMTRTRFERRIRGEEGSARAASVSESEALPERVSAVLTLENLLLTGTASTDPWDARLGFLEVLDDVRYDNAFRAVPRPGETALLQVEPFEEVVDPVRSEDPAAAPPGWASGDVVVPLLAENKPNRRTVHLASRSLVVPPVLIWAGEAPALDAALADSSNWQTRPWSAEALRERRGPNTGETGLIMPLQPYRDTGAGSRPFADTGKAWALYRIEGDEETSKLLESLENDGIFIRLPAAPQQMDADMLNSGSLELADAVDEFVEQQLRILLISGRGSSQTAEAVDKLALDPTPAARARFQKSMSAIINPGKASIPEKDFALIRPPRGVTPREQPGTGAAGPIGDVALFRPTTAGEGMVQYAYLLFSFRTEVWEPKRLELLHGRNLRYDAWGAGETAAPAEPVFNNAFWQAAPQAGSPTRHALTKAYSNEAADWSRADRKIGLPTGWRGQRTAQDLIRTLLFNNAMTIRGLDAGPILSPGAQAKLFQRELSISVYHEQFDDDPGGGASPAGRLLLLSQGFRSATDAAEFFDEMYDHFSVDFHWYSSSGLSLLRLDRLFVSFT